MLLPSTFIATEFRHRMVGVICILVLLPNLCSPLSAQSLGQPSADPRGWKLTPSIGDPEQAGLNRPVAIQQHSDELNVSFGSHESTLTQDTAQLFPDNDVRRQIGLASFTETQDAPSALPLVPPKGAAPDLTDQALSELLTRPTEALSGPTGIQGSIKFALLLGALSLAPAIILMTTSYVRVVVVLSLLKQAFGGQQLPPAQVVTALSLFISILIMTPVWKDLKKNAIDPYSAQEIEWNEAWERGVVPIKSFMVRQIQLAGNEDSVAVFYKYADVGSSHLPNELSEVPLNVLIPAFMISELKIAFLLGFQIFLPFLVLDLIVSSVTVSMGMLMLPPQIVSFPLKLVLFVLVDGWNLVIGMLLQSFGTLM